MRRWLQGFFLLTLLTSSLAWGAASDYTQRLNSLPSSTSAFATWQTFLAEEEPERYADQFRDFVHSGLTAGTGVGLSHVFAAGRAYVQGYVVNVSGTVFSYTASRRTFLFLDWVSTRTAQATPLAEVSFTGGTGCTFLTRISHVVFAECASGSLVPTPSAALLLLMHVDTDANDITVVEDYRGTTPVAGQAVNIMDRGIGGTCNGVADDTASLRTAVAIGKNLQRPILIPAYATCRITAEVEMQAVPIFGMNRRLSVIRVVGAIRGLVYTAPGLSTADATLSIHDLGFEGSSNAVSGGTLELLTVTEANYLYIDRVRFHTTSTYGVKVHGGVNVHIDRTDFQAFRLGGIYFLGAGSTIGVVNSWSITRNWFEHGLGYGIILSGTDTGFIGLMNIFEGLDGGLHADGMIHCAGACNNITIDTNYGELYSTYNIVISGQSRHLQILNNILHSSSNAKINLRGTTGQAAAHTETEIKGNFFHGANSPSGTTKYIVCSENQVSAYIDHNEGHGDDVANAPVWISGCNATTTDHRVYKYPTGERPIYTTGLDIGDNEGNITKSADTLTIAAADSAGVVALRAAGADQAQATATGMTVRRLYGTLGAVPTSGNFVLHANWGVGATVSDIVGTDTAFSFVVNSGTGAGNTPTIIYTFASGSWGPAPIVLVARTGGNNMTILPTWTVTNQILTITHLGTPGTSTMDDSGTFAYSVHVIGR